MKLGGRVGLAGAGAAVALLVLGCAGPREATMMPVTPTAGATRVVPVRFGKARLEVDADKVADDATRAAALLASLMTRHPEEGFRVLSVGSGAVGVARGPYKFLIQPQIEGVGKPNRFLVKQFYEVKSDEAQHAEKLEELCFEINSTMRFVQASLLQAPGRTLFVLTSELAFGDVITLRELATYLDELKHETLAQGGRRMAAYLK